MLVKCEAMKVYLRESGGAAPCILSFKTGWNLLILNERTRRKYFLQTREMVTCSNKKQGTVFRMYWLCSKEMSHSFGIP
jgi:hypothetical protein